jgi:hypothetical protein
MSQRHTRAQLILQMALKKHENIREEQCDCNDSDSSIKTNTIEGAMDLMEDLFSSDNNRSSFMTFKKPVTKPQPNIAKINNDPTITAS